ncbi:MAG: thiamine diphosphokinase [Clostridia bacterium]|nr:thiamine diphosphokinase [Clostridia bacterium]
MGAGPSVANIRPGAEDFVIAADAGLAVLQQWGIMPDLIVGDFDSLGHVPAGENVTRHPTQKDDTDLMLAVRTGLARGYKRFLLCGALGGRLDHTMANIQTLLFLAEQGAQGFLVGENECLTVIRNGAVTFKAAAVGTISVFAVGGPAGGVSLCGLRYSLENAALTPGFPLGVSNAFIGWPATVKVAQGSLLIYWTGQPDMIEEKEI